MSKTKTAREEILSRISSSLRGGKGAGPSLPPEARRRDRGGSAPDFNMSPEARREALIERFKTELERVGGRFHSADSPGAVCSRVQQIASTFDARSAIGWSAPLIDRLGLAESLESAGVSFLTDAHTNKSGEFVREATGSKLGITGVDYALSDTGTLVLLAGEGRARSASLLTPVHIAIVEPEQIITGLDELFFRLREEQIKAGSIPPSAITFITGPSRTADIEMTLVVGVHGPQHLHVILAG